MELAAALSAIRQHLERMDAAYRRPIFDEWAVLSLGGGAGGILAYTGPRAESFRSHLAADAGPLRDVAAERSYGEGDFVFALDSKGTRFDAFMRLGPSTYLVCNNTQKSMEDIRSDPLWLQAQKPFFDLSEKFRADPLQQN